MKGRVFGLGFNMKGRVFGLGFYMKGRVFGLEFYIYIYHLLFIVNYF